MLEVTLDMAVILLLVVTLAFGARLQRWLRGLRSDGAELKDLIDALGNAVSRAETVLGELKRVSLEHAGRIDDEQRRAERLSDDLGMLTERADREADRLAELIGEVRGLGRGRSPMRSLAAVRQSSAEPEEAEAAPSPERDRGALERTLRSLR